MGAIIYQCASDFAQRRQGLIQHEGGKYRADCGLVEAMPLNISCYYQSSVRISETSGRVCYRPILVKNIQIVPKVLPNNKLKLAGAIITILYANSNLITTLKAPIGVTTMAGANEYAIKFAASPTITAMIGFLGSDIPPLLTGQ